MTTQLVRFTQWAQQQPQPRYNALIGMLTDPQGLRESFDKQPGNKAAGADGVRKADYEVNVDSKLNVPLQSHSLLRFPVIY